MKKLHVSIPNQEMILLEDGVVLKTIQYLLQNMV